MDKVILCAVQDAVRSKSISATASHLLLQESNKLILFQERRQRVWDHAAKTWNELVCVWAHVRTMQCGLDWSNWIASTVDAETKASALWRDTVRNGALLDKEWLYIQYTAAIAARSAQADYELLENELRYDPCLPTDGGPALKGDCEAMQ